MNLSVNFPSFAPWNGLPYAPFRQSTAPPAPVADVVGSNSGPESVVAPDAASLSALTPEQIIALRYLGMAEALRRLVGGGYFMTLSFDRPAHTAFETHS